MPKKLTALSWLFLQQHTDHTHVHWATGPRSMGSRDGNAFSLFLQLWLEKVGEVWRGAVLRAHGRSGLDPTRPTGWVHLGRSKASAGPQRPTGTPTHKRSVPVSQAQPPLRHLHAPEPHSQQGCRVTSSILLTPVPPIDM